VPVDTCPRVEIYLRQLKAGHVTSGQACVKVLTADQPSKREWRLFRVKVEVSHDRSDPNSAPGVWGVATDITGQRAMEDELTTSRNLFQSIIESVSQGIAVMDRQGRVTYLNRALRDLAPNPAEEFVSGMPREMSDCLTGVGAEEITHRALRGEAAEFEFSCTLGDQDRRIRANVNPLVSDKGENLGAVLVTSDLTEVMSLRDQVAAVQKMDALGTLAGGIAHDMNNILTAVQGYLQLINSFVSVGDFRKVPAYSREMQSALTRAAELVRQILTFSRRPRHDVQPTQVRPLVNEAVKLLRASLPPDIEIVSDPSGADAMVMADPARLRQIMMNLGTNASHAMEEGGGTLTISIDIVAEPEQSVPQDLNPGRYVVISFRDTGVGIPNELQPRIFEPFFTTKQPGRGTGLGLSVVYGIVTEIGGAVKVDSVEGHATQVRVFLPQHVLENEGTPTIEMPEPEPASATSARVLFVDDEEALTDLGAISLERLGHSIVSCTNGQTAFDMFSYDPDRFDLVVTDHIMPELLGHQLAVQIRQLRPDIPVVIATGTGEDYTQEHAEEAGFHYLPKPYTLEQLASVVSRCLSQ